MNNNLKIDLVTTSEVEALHGRKVDFPVICYIGREGGEVVGAGGLCWRFNLCFVWLSINGEATERSPYKVISWAKRMARTAKKYGETEIFCYREDLPTSKRLLEFLGFDFHSLEEVTLEDGVVEQKELWLWQI